MCIRDRHVDKLVDQFVRAQGTIGIKAGSKHALSGGITPPLPHPARLPKSSAAASKIDTVFFISVSSLSLPITDFRPYSCFMPNLLRDFRYALPVGQAV